MIILKAISTAQTIDVFARSHTLPTLYTVTIIDEGLHDITSTSDIIGVYSDGSISLEISHDFIEGNFYAVQIYTGDNLIAFHKIYVTDQIDFEKYTVINGYYDSINKPETNYIVKPTL